MRVPRATEPKAAEPGAPEPPASSRRVSRDREFEIALGTRIRSARLASNMSQTALGEAVGISFQQIQKYELGKDRVASGTLQGIAAALGLHPGSFFDGDLPAASGTVAQIREAQRIGSRILAIKNRTVVKRILALIDELAGDVEGSRVPAGDGAGEAE